MINIGNGEQEFNKDARDCGRIIWDDRDLVAKIFARCEASVTEILELKDKPLITGNGPVKRKETWRLSRLNERMRFLKYVEGNYFRRESICLPLPAKWQNVSWRAKFYGQRTVMDHLPQKATRRYLGTRCTSTSMNQTKSHSSKVEQRRSTP